MDAVRIEFVRSIFLLPEDAEGNAAAFKALFDFITASAAAPISQDDLERLERYLKEALCMLGHPETDQTRLITEIASIARRASGGETVFKASQGQAGRIEVGRSINRSASYG